MVWYFQLFMLFCGLYQDAIPISITWSSRMRRASSLTYHTTREIASTRVDIAPNVPRPSLILIRQGIIRRRRGSGGSFLEVISGGSFLRVLNNSIGPPY